MPTTIWKYLIRESGTVIDAPGSRGTVRQLDRDPLTGTPAVWIELADPKASHRTKLRVEIFGTGHEIPEGGDYLGSLVSNGVFVWHYYAYEVE